MTPIDTFLTILGSLVFFVLIMFFFTSLKEKERTAAARSILLALTLPLIYVLPAFIDFSGKGVVSVVIVWATLGLILLFIIPTGKPRSLKDGVPNTRFDERDVMFSRYFMEVGGWQYKDYYQRNPDKLDIDSRFRNAPGLLSPTAKYSHPFYFASADVGFGMCEHLSEIADGPPAPDRQNADPASVTSYLRSWLLHMGALSVGFTRLKEYHWYSIAGRGENYGTPIQPVHEYALACTVEMDYYMVRTGPQAPEAMEVGWKYLQVATLAVQAASFIRSLGYSAKAHIDGSYQVLCPLVARDAGLGELGRMGILMTPERGPRVRIAVVSTDLPLIPDTRRFKTDIIDFCSKCTKCARCCPTQAIPDGERKEENGVLRWRIDHEKCFSYWCTVGTDCGTCLSVCPYSHTGGVLHNSVRTLSRNSGLFRRAAIKMDDLFYKKRPKSLPHPPWSPGSNQ